VTKVVTTRFTTRAVKAMWTVCPRTGADEPPKMGMRLPRDRHAVSLDGAVDHPGRHPMTSAQRWNRREYRPTTMAGKVCRIQIPASS
jgi:hypothetical protein